MEHDHSVGFEDEVIAIWAEWLVEANGPRHDAESCYATTGSTEEVYGRPGVGETNIGCSSHS